MNVDTGSLFPEGGGERGWMNHFENGANAAGTLDSQNRSLGLRAGHVLSVVAILQGKVKRSESHQTPVGLLVVRSWKNPERLQEHGVGRIASLAFPLLEDTPDLRLIMVDKLSEIRCFEVAVPGICRNERLENDVRRDFLAAQCQTGVFREAMLCCTGVV